MAINPKDFLFHSDFTVNSLISTYKDTINSVSESLAANTSKSYYGPWHDVGPARIVSVPTWIVPTLPQVNPALSQGQYAPGAIRRGGFTVSTTQTGGGQPTGIWFLPFVEQDNGKVRAGLRAFNNTTIARNIPPAVWLIKVSTYLVPPKTT